MWNSCLPSSRNLGGSPPDAAGKGKGKPKGDWDGKGGKGPGGIHRAPGDWRSLKNHRRMLNHMMTIAPVELQTAESACADAEEEFRKEQTKENMDALHKAKHWVKNRELNVDWIALKLRSRTQSVLQRSS